MHTVKIEKNYERILKIFSFDVMIMICKNVWDWNPKSLQSYQNVCFIWKYMHIYSVN